MRPSSGTHGTGIVIAWLLIWLVVGALVTVGPARAGELPDPGRAPPGGVKRIVSLAPSVTETIFALGEGSRLVGISTFCDWPPEATHLQRVGSYLEPNVELIIAQQPDLVIGVPNAGNQPAVRRLELLGFKVLIVGESTLGETWFAIRAIAAWVGRETEGAALVERVQGELEATRKLAALQPQRRVLFVVGHDPLVAAGAGLFLDELIRLAGGINVAAPTGVRWPHLSLEAVVAASPEVIIDGAMGNEQDKALLEYWKSFASLPAVRDGRVVAHRSALLLRPGPRLGAAARELLTLVHGKLAETMTRTGS